MPTVLIVEDEWVIADALTAALTDAGYRVLTAANGRIALELLAELRPDVILLDFMMPIMNGAATLDAINANPEFRDIPVIFMTSLAESRVAEQATGFRGFLGKPFTTSRVLETVATVLASRAP
jgi:CheY-like chemotaxis protein